MIEGVGAVYVYAALDGSQLEQPFARAGDLATTIERSSCARTVKRAYLASTTFVQQRT
jgi:hypothetical protein